MMLTDEQRENIREVAECVDLWTPAIVAEKPRQATDTLHALGAAVVALMGSAPLTDAEAGAIQAVSEVERLRRENAALRTALAPFAKYAERRNAYPLRGLGDVIHSIHAGSLDKEAELTLTDCRRARAVLGTTPAARVFTEAEVREACASVSADATPEADSAIPHSREHGRAEGRAIGAGEVAKRLGLTLD